jgi:hypothetical protein
METPNNQYLVSPWIEVEYAKVWLNKQPKEYVLTNVVRHGRLLALFMRKQDPNEKLVLPPIMF